MKHVLKKRSFLIAVVIVIVVSFIFQARLFIPNLQLITTPEFELNDATQLSYASKYWYWEKLHERELPFWSTEMGAGFPVLGEGQTGIFFLPNIILYGISPSAPLAYDLSLMLVTVTAALGTYVWLSLFTVPWIISVIAGLTFAGSGFFVFHLQHITLLQSFSLLPWLFVATHLLFKKQRFRDCILFSILLSQQIFAGFMQAVFITTIGLTVYAFFLWKQSEKNKRGLFLLLLSYVIGVLLAAPQLLPSIEFYRHIIEQSVGEGFSTRFSFSFKSFLSFLTPFAMGNPKYGTYYNTTQDEGLLFWETNGFVGVLPLVLMASILFIKKSWGKIKPFIILLCISIFLMLGKFSPFYFIYDFFPFTLFRVPARFVILTSFMLITIGSIATHYSKKQWSHRILTIFWIINLISILPYWFTYHEWKKPSDITNKPIIANYISTDSIVYRYNPTWQHRAIYMKQGWIKSTEFDIFQNALRPNTNIFWGITTFDTYPSRTLSKKATIDQIIERNIEISNNHIATMSAEATNLLTLSGISTIVSGDIIDTHDLFPLVKKISDGVSTIYLYQQPSILPRAYLVSAVIPVSTTTDVVKTIREPDFDPKTTALLEGIDIKQQTHLSLSDTISIVRWSDQDIVVKTTTTDPTTVIFHTTYYPGWIGTIDGVQTTLHPANIISTSLMVPAGEHTIQLQYKPVSLVIGIIITGCTLAILCLVALVRKHIPFFRKTFPE